MAIDPLRSDPVAPADKEPLEFLAGGGQVGELMRALDWSRTPLGVPVMWPQSLRTAVSLCLSSRSPILLWWGPQLIEIYNDEYRPVLGATKHPRALGAPGQELWPEIWHIIGPMLESVMQEGAATRQTDQQMFLDRNGYLEESYFTYAYSPIRDESGGVGGVFSTVFETTERVIGERRLRVLRDLAARIAGVKSVQEACDRLMAVLGEDQLDIPCAALYILDKTAGSAWLAAHCGALPAALRPSTLPLERSEPWPLAAVLESAQPELVSIDADIRIDVPHWPGDAITQLLVLPVQGQGSTNSAAVLIAGVSSRRALDDAYRGFFDLVAGQFAAAIADAQAYEGERRRAEALAEIDRAKTIFFSNVSHEFRTPLTLMLGPIEEAASDPAAPPAMRAQLALAHRNSLRLLKLVNSLLDFSRIEAGRMHASYAPTNLAALTRDLSSIFRSAIEGAGLRFEVHCEPLDEPVYVDQEMWEKVVLNLLSNAFKFTLQGAISVRLRGDGGGAVLQVADTGVGVPAAELPRLFERFHRIENTRARTHEGSGIGLALVHELVKLHGGTVNVESRLGHGTTFQVRLPLGRSHLPANSIKATRSQATAAVSGQAFLQEALRWQAEAANELSTALLTHSESPAAPLDHRFSATFGARIVLADDNADMRSYIRELLGPHYSVEAVVDGKAALEAIRRRRPDLVLSDVMMPQLDGFALLKALRSDVALSDIPVILLSARAGEESTIEGLGAGADDYLVKPFSARELVARVGALLERTRSERALEARSEELRQTLETAATGLTRLDRNLRYVTANSAYARLTGVPREQIVAHTLEEVIGPAALAKVRPYIERVLGGETVEYEAELPWIATGPSWIHAIYTPWRESDGAVGGWVASLVDITSRKQTQQALEEREEQLRLATEAAEIGLWDVDMVANSLFWPARVKAMFGISSGMSVSMDDFYSGLHPDDRDRVSEAFAAAVDPSRRSLYDVEYRTVGKEDGITRWVAAKGRGFFDGSGLCVRVLGTAIDITQRKQIQLALEDASRQKDEFLAMLAHELRNPLAPIGTASELLARTAGHDGRSQAAVAMIKRQVTQLTRLVDDLLDVSRITQGKITLQISPIEVGDIVTRAVETVEAQVREKSHKLRVISSTSFGALRVNVDAARLVQCIGNLLTNAAKYTEPGGEICVRTHANDTDVFIEVTDTGIGISAELQPRVFDLFVQSERTLDRSQGGLGIGLAVVKRLIEMHHGSVTVHSRGTGQGSTFAIRLPRWVRPVRTAEQEAPVKARPRRVLIVDDNADAALSLSMLLEIQGHKTEIAYRPSEALAAVETFKPEVALLDIGLPEMDGYELARQLRTKPQLHGMRLIALTGYGQAEDYQRTRAAGFDGHLVKPLNLATLERLLA